MDLGVALGIAAMFGVLVMVICIVWCNIRRSVKRPLSRPSRISLHSDTSLGMIYSVTLPGRRSPYLTNSVTEYIRNEEGMTQQKELQNTIISGLPKYEDVISNYKSAPPKDGDAPPPYSLT